MSFLCSQCLKPGSFETFCTLFSLKHPQLSFGLFALFWGMFACGHVALRGRVIPSIQWLSVHHSFPP